MNTADEIRSIRSAYEQAEFEEREQAIRAVKTKWNPLFLQLQWECEQETGHRISEGRCVLCGKNTTKQNNGKL